MGEVSAIFGRGVGIGEGLSNIYCIKTICSSQSQMVQLGNPILKACHLIRAGIGCGFGVGWGFGGYVMDNAGAPIGVAGLGAGASTF
eukprot:7322134-Pyramimonas_sp.AAC.1